MKTFEEKLKSMTAKDVVLAMVEGLEKEWVQVDMSTYGESTGSVCFGCAATNTICQINGAAFNADHIDDVQDRADFVHGNIEVVNWFEAAINSLREGDIEGYNFWVKGAKLYNLEIPYYDNSSVDLPYLRTGDYRENLQAYRDFANLL